MKNKPNYHRVTCNNCYTQVGHRETISYLSSESKTNKIKQDKIKMDTIKESNNNQDKQSDESEIWTLISSDFSDLKAPSLQSIHELDNEYNINEQQDDRRHIDEDHDDNDGDGNMYLYHLTNVLPGVL